MLKQVRRYNNIMYLCVTNIALVTEFSNRFNRHNRFSKPTYYEKDPPNKNFKIALPKSHFKMYILKITHFHVCVRYTIFFYLY